MLYLLGFLAITVVILLIPKRKASYVFSLVVVSAGIVSSSWLAADTLFGGAGSGQYAAGILRVLFGDKAVCDNLSAVFILIINFTVASGLIYSSGYLKHYYSTVSPLWIRVHYMALVWLHASMILVVLFRDGFSFLVVWELMTLSSFLLVVFDFNKKGTIQAGINYLVQMHIGMLFILFGLLISSQGEERISFDNLSTFFAAHPNWPVFLIFFTGFGLKAGFILLHTWLPEAHPAAPSHVSGIMSGVMIKLGIYGILRVTAFLQSDLQLLGTIVIVVSAVTGLYGVMMAIFQHDVKKLLAYHSIENIGIIGLGIGLGIFGNATGNAVIAVTGFTGAVLHTLNHSLFKSLLFYSAGSVISRLHTQNIEKMGGVIRYMPFTAAAFLIGSVAICGLPPFNGFVSEYLVYYSMFTGIGSGDFFHIMIFTFAMVALVLIGGLAIFCFTKVFSIVFLGQPRSSYAKMPEEVGAVMLTAKLLPVIPVILIGVLPVLIVPGLTGITGDIFVTSTGFTHESITGPLSSVSYIAAAGAGIVLVIWLLRRICQRRIAPVSGPTWGCGYPAADAKHQYTATSFIQEYSALIRPVIKNGASNVLYKDDEIFAGKRDFHTSSSDFFRSKIIMRLANFIVNVFRKTAVLQTGKLQHYVLYALLFLVLVFTLTFLKII